MNTNQNSSQVSVDACILPIHGLSASSIASGSNRILYDMFTPPTTYQSYIPNKRIRHLVEQFKQIPPNHKEALKIELKLRTNTRLMQSWSYPNGGSETRINDPLLKNFITTIYDLFSDFETVLSHHDESFQFQTQLCSQNSKQDMFISYQNSVLLVSEAKGIESSETVAMMQCLQASNDGALNLYSKGLLPEECIVPGILCCGEALTIVAVYFAPITFPVITYLSGSLHICNCEDRIILSRWGVALH